MDLFGMLFCSCVLLCVRGPLREDADPELLWAKVSCLRNATLKATLQQPRIHDPARGIAL